MRLISFKTVLYLISFFALHSIGAQVTDLNLNESGKLEMACLDENKDLHLLVQHPDDSIAIYKLDKSNNSWNLISIDRYGTLAPWNIFNVAKFCTFHRGDLYVSSLTKNGLFSTTYVSKFNGNAWTDVDTFPTNSKYPSQVISLNSKLYFQFVNPSDQRQVKYYDSSANLTFTDTTITNYMSSARSFTYDLLPDGDSVLLFKNSDSVYRYAPGINPSFLGSTARPSLNFIYDKEIYGFNESFQGNGQVYKSRFPEYKSVVSDLYGVSQHIFLASNGDLILVEQTLVPEPSGNVKTVTALSRKRGNNWVHLASVQNSDTSYVSPVFNDTNVYLIGKSGSSFSYRNQKFGNVISLNLRQFNPPGMDTVLVWVYVDKNENGIKDPSEPLRKPLGNIPVSANAPYYFTLPDDLSASYSLASYDGIPACLAVKIRTHQSDVFNNSKNRDTLWYSEFDLETDFYTVAVDGEQRLDKRQVHYFRYFNAKCLPSLSPTTFRIRIPEQSILHSSTPNFTQRVGNELVYSVGNKQEGYVKLDLEFPFDKFKYGDSLKVYTQVSNSSDKNSLNNYDTSCITLKYSYDPNNKKSVPHGKVAYPVKEMEYTINFENEGNGYAENVIILDTLDSKLSIFDLIILGSSHPVKLSGQGNILRWEFNSINLEPKSEINTKSKGFVHFKARTAKALNVGDSIRNKASIYFDKNTPIVTNWAIVQRVHPDSLNVSVEPAIFGQKNEIKVYPNPSEKQLWVENLTSKVKEFKLFNTQGQLVLKFTLGARETMQLNTQNVFRGFYVLITESEALKIQVR